MIRLTIHQTLADRNNPDYVEDNGPFETTNSKAWLGIGYYFWDTHIELAHWWGNVGYQGNYMVCRAKVILDDTCWDLHGRGEHRIEFKLICDEIVKSGVSTKESLLVPQVIEFLKNRGKFMYSAIRALGMRSILDKSPTTDEHLLFRMRFIEKNYAYLDIHPPVQLCLLNKKSLSLQKYKVVYPNEYSEFYA